MDGLGPLTPAHSLPKMALLTTDRLSEAAKLANPAESIPRNLYRAIATDIHFWIPLVVLIGGVFLLDKLR